MKYIRRAFTATAVAPVVVLMAFMSIEVLVPSRAMLPSVGSSVPICLLPGGLVSPNRP